MAKRDTKDLRKYEMMVVIKASLPDTQKKQALKKITDQLVTLGGSIEEEQVWGKRHLAFPIKKQQEGYYVVYNLFMRPEQAAEFNRLLNIDSDVLRFIIRNVDAFEKITMHTEQSK